jgi:hypothetical protein
MAYAGYEGITEQAYLERMGVPFLTPEIVGQGLAYLLKDDVYRNSVAFSVSGAEIAPVN